MYCYPCTLYTLLNLLYPYVHFAHVYTLGSFKSLLCLETFNSSNHTKAEFFFLKLVIQNVSTPEVFKTLASPLVQSTPGNSNPL